MTRRGEVGALRLADNYGPDFVVQARMGLWGRYARC
jgi:hypothetical protein